MKTRFATICCFLAQSVGLGLAQTSTGGISGTVRDSSGAGVPQARLTLTNLDTNARREQESDEHGIFSFTSLPPARYRLEAERTGFKKFVEEPIEVRVQLFVAVQPVLEVGTTSETIPETLQFP